MIDDTVQQTQAPKTGMSRFAKIALIVGTIVILVVLAEVAYILFNRHSGLLTTTQEPETPTTPIVQTQPQTPSPTPVPLNQTTELNQAFVENFLPSLEVLNANPGFVSEATTLITIRGRVRNAGDVDFVIDNSLQATYQIELENDNGQTINYYFTDQEIVITTAVLVGTSGQGIIPITEIQPGDRLLIRQYKNLLEPSPHSTRISIEIRRP